MNNDSIPTQRKRELLQTRQAKSMPGSEQESILTPYGETLTPEQLWHKWETEARYQPLTPQENWQLEMDHKALVEMQKIDPTIGHALYMGEAAPLTPEARKALRELFVEASLQKEAEKVKPS